jgi:uncharacterized Fe-S cluster-containing radical SAM superfamily enzyme
MKEFYMYLCDVCGFSREKAGICIYCETPLSQYSKDSQAEYQIDMEEAMRSMSEYRWYI